MSTTATARPRPRPVLIWMSVLAGLQALTGGAALAELIGPRWAGLAILAVAATQAGIQLYVQAQVTPLSNPRTNAGTRLIPLTASRASLLARVQHNLGDSHTDTAGAPRLGQMVLYQLTGADADFITARTAAALDRKARQHNPVHAGQTYPAFVAAVLPGGRCNLHVLLDGDCSHWAPNRTVTSDKATQL